MKKIILLAGAMLLSLTAGVSCTPEPEQEQEASMRLYDTAGNAVEGVQSLVYGERRMHKLVSRNVHRVDVTGPDGWVCEFYVKAQQAIITAPDVTDSSAESGGEITVSITSVTGALSTYTLEVAAYEDDVAFDFVKPVSGVQKFGYSQTAEYAVATTNVAGFDFTAPAGWSAAADLTALPYKIRVTAPGSSAGVDTSGKIRITPKSARGSTGAAKEMDVSIDASIASLLMDAEYTFTGFGDNKTIDFEPVNVTAASIKSFPAGWNTSINLASKKFTVSPPANGSDPLAYGSGVIVIELKDGQNQASEFPVAVKIEMNGIATPGDFLAFAEAVTNGTAIPQRLLIGGNPTMVLNVDLSPYPNATFAGSGSNKFAGTFDGNGRTVDIDMTIPEDGGVCGLFHTLASGAKVKNLAVKGNILCLTKKNAGDKLMIAGAIAAYNEGAEISGCTTNVDFTYRPDGYQNLDKTHDAYYGSMSGKVTGAASFSNNKSCGKIWMDVGAMHGAGGHVGAVIAGGVTFDACVNEGAIHLDFGDNTANNADNTIYGGIVADARDATPVYEECINRGNITVDWHGVYHTTSTQRQVFGVGGIAGSSYGTFDKCENHGSITATDGGATNTRRYGGILGVAYADAQKLTHDLYMKDCVNYGDITHTSNAAGGIAAAIVDAKYAEIDGCINRGNITNPLVLTSADSDYKTRQPDRMSGLFGTSRADLTKNCVNYGKVSGQCKIRAAGIIAECRGVDNNDGMRYVENCVNHGEINVSTIKGTAGNLAVAGVVVVQQQSWTIKGCSNDGKLITGVETAGQTKNVYFRQGGTVNADSATETDQSVTTYITETVLQ